VNVVEAVVLAESSPFAFNVMVYEPGVVPRLVMGVVDDPDPPPPQATRPLKNASNENVSRTLHRRARGTTRRISARKAPPPLQPPGRNGWAIALEDAVVLMTTEVLAADVFAVNVTDGIMPQVGEWTAPEGLDVIEQAIDTVPTYPLVVATEIADVPTPPAVTDELDALSVNIAATTVTDAVPVAGPYAEALAWSGV
jgi:hypothetical protein